jgi:hypothetical protein
MALYECDACIWEGTKPIIDRGTEVCPECNNNVTRVKTLGDQIAEEAKTEYESKYTHKWEQVNGDENFGSALAEKIVRRFSVPGGWIYVFDEGPCFVPNPAMKAISSGVGGLIGGLLGGSIPLRNKKDDE